MVSISRRALLRSTAGVTSAATLAACGGSAAPTPVQAPIATPEPSLASPAVEATAAPAGATTSSVAETASATPQAPESTAAGAAVGSAYLAAAHGASPTAITEAAIEAIGGIGRFVKTGDDVIVKPNMCVSYHGPEYAATTNPEVLATVVRLCKDAGAKRVRVMDFPFGGSAREAYTVTGIQAAVEAAGGEMELMANVKYAEVEFPTESVDIRKWVVYRDALEVDALINVPIAKHHGSALLTLGAKNLMGLVESRNLIHINLHQRIADLVTLFRPKLTVMDAVRILMANGPSGGSLGDVKQMDTVIASHDIVAVDAYTTRFFPFADTDKVEYIKLSAKAGMGTLDLDSVDVREIEV